MNSLCFHTDRTHFKVKQVQCTESINSLSFQTNEKFLNPYADKYDHTQQTQHIYPMFD